METGPPADLTVLQEEDPEDLLNFSDTEDRVDPDDDYEAFLTRKRESKMMDLVILEDCVPDLTDAMIAKVLGFEKRQVPWEVII